MYKPQSQRTTFLSTDTVVKPGAENVDADVQAELGRTASMDEALRYLDTTRFHTRQTSWKTANSIL